MKYQKLINSNIKQLRIKNGMTQEEFAERIGLSIQGISNIERNRYQPTSDTIDKICKQFNILPVELLLTDNKDNESTLNNILHLLKNCSTQKLKQIFEIVKIIAK